MTKRDPLVPFGVLILGATSSIAIATMRRLAAQNAQTGAGDVSADRVFGQGIAGTDFGSETASGL